MWVYLISSVLASFVVYDNCIFRSPTQMTALSECLVDFSFSLLLLNSLLALSYCACGCLKSAQKPWNSSIRRLFCRSISTQRTEGKDWNWAYFVRLVPYGWRIFLLLPQTEHRFAVDCFVNCGVDYFWLSVGLPYDRSCPCRSVHCWMIILV